MAFRKIRLDEAPPHIQAQYAGVTVLEVRIRDEPSNAVVVKSETRFGEVKEEWWEYARGRGWVRS